MMKKFLSLALALVMCLSLVACGGGGAAKLEEPSFAEGNIVVGNTAATTGAFAPIGVPFNAGLEAAFKAYNDNGGFNGRMIEFKHYDDGFDAAQGLTYTKSLVETDKVFAIVGHFGTNTVGATLDYLKENGVPMVYAATGIDALYNEKAEGNDRVIYPVQPLYISEGRVLLARTVAPSTDHVGLGAQKVGVIATTDDAGSGLVSGVAAQAEELQVELVRQDVDAAATDYSAAVNVLKNNKCDVVIACMNQIPLATLLASMRDANYNADVITSYVSASPVTLGASVADGSITADRMCYVTGWLDLTTEQAQADYAQFYTAMNAWELVNGGSGNDNAINSFAMSGYIAGDIFIQALKAMAEQNLELTRSNFNDVMESTDFHVCMGGNLNYRDGRRLAITDLALNSISLTPDDAGVYQLQVLSHITSLDDVLATIQ